MPDYEEEEENNRRRKNRRNRRRRKEGVVTGVSNYPENAGVGIMNDDIEF